MFEQEVKACLRAARIEFQDATSSKTALDFYLPQQRIGFDAKEKIQPISLKNWGNPPIAQENLFIIDDLAARKLLQYAPLSFCLIKDSSASPILYYIYSIVDLLCIPKRRINRPIERRIKALKGKWLLDLRDAAVFDELIDALHYMLQYKKKLPRIFSSHIACWGKYPSEQITEAGILRTERFWKKDSSAHH